MCDRHSGRQTGAGRDPGVISFEFHAELVVMDPQIAISAAGDCRRHDRLHVLRQHADISDAAAVIDETVEADAVVETPEQRDVVLQSHVGAASAAATTRAAASAATWTATAPRHRRATATAWMETAAATRATAAEAGAAA